MNGRVRRRVPSAGFEHVLVVGRRRRRRARTTGVTVFTALALTLGLGVHVTNSGDGGVGLDVADDGDRAPRRTATASPGPAEGPRGPAPTSSEAVPLALVPGSSASASPPARPRAERSPVATPEPVMSGPGKTDDFSHCPDIMLGAYCTAVTGPETLTPGTRAQYTFWVCRNRAAIPETVTFATRQEAEFVVHDARRAERWRWSRGYVFPPQRHAMTVDAGYCYTWTVEWTGVDARGRALPAGEYVVTASPWAEEWRARQAEDPEPAILRVRVPG